MKFFLVKKLKVSSGAADGHRSSVAAQHEGLFQKVKYTSQALKHFTTNWAGLDFFGLQTLVTRI